MFFQGGWQEAHAAPMLHICRLLEALLEAGCQPLPNLEIGEQQAVMHVVGKGTSEARELPLPRWATDVLRSANNLTAQRPWLN
jgi:hypothetical protein